MRMSWRSVGTGSKETGSACTAQERERERGLFIMDGAFAGRQGYAGDSEMLVSIRSYEEGVPRGAFLSFEYNQRYEFQGLDQMLLKMEDIMDAVSVPQPAFEHKSFYGEPYRIQEAEPGQRVSGTRRRPEDLPRLSQGKASFALRFRYRQHGSLQGEFIAAAEPEGMERKVAFRSALELMRLIHEYLARSVY